MSAGSDLQPNIPQDTYTAARTVYNIQHVYLRIGDRLDEILQPIDLPLLDPTSRLAADTIFRLALITAFQYAEHLPDPIASEATLKRMDWKYALHLPARHHGFSPQSLCAFRQNLFTSSKAMREFDQVLEHLGAAGLYAQNTFDQLVSNLVLEKVCKLTCLYQLNTGMKSALFTLVANSPAWLVENMPRHWYARYKTGPLSEQPGLNGNNMEEEAVKLGSDIQFLLTTLKKQNLMDMLDLADMKNISRLFAEQFFIKDEQLHWRQPNCTCCTRNAQGEMDA